jgi:hypothetical protein
MTKSQQFRDTTNLYRQTCRTPNERFGTMVGILHLIAL